MHKSLNIILLSLVMGQSLVAPLAIAQSGGQQFNPGSSNQSTNPKELPNPLGSTNTLTQLLDKLISALFLIAVPIVTIMVLYGAFMIMSSAGDPGKVETGKKTILYAAVGFGILLLSKAISLIVANLLGVSI